MKRTISILLSVICVLSSCFCVDFSAYAKMSTITENSNTTQQHIAGIDNEKSLSKYPEFCNYRASGEFCIPGLESTVSYNKEKKLVICDTMTPQAMCKVAGRTLITAYDSDGECKSVIYVLDSGNKLIKTLIVPDGFKVGGISYDTENKMIVIAKSGKRCLGCISEEDFLTYMSSEKPYVRIKYTISECSLDVRPPYASGVTYHKGKIYITSFANGYDSCMLCYTPEYNHDENTYNLVFNYRVALPDYVQGATLYDYSSDTRLILSVSYGRNASKGVYESYLYTYAFDTARGAKTLCNILACPPMLQQTYCYKSKLYCLFENGAKLYHSANKDPLDIVVPIKLYDICFEKSGTVINIGYTNVYGGKEIDITSSAKNAKIYYSTSSNCPYISRGYIYGGKAFKKYVKTESSPICAVAVVDGRIVASDYMDIKVKKTKTPKKPTRKSRTSDSITIKWKKTPKVKGYYLYRAKGENGKYKLIATVGGTKTEFTDKKLKSETTYCYKMVAYKMGYADSDFSKTVSIKTKKKPTKKKSKTDKKSDTKN